MAHTIPGFYEFLRGNGNDGESRRAIVMLDSTDCPFAAVEALTLNEFIVTSKTRRYITRQLPWTPAGGESDHGTFVTISEGPKGETEFGAAWLCATLRPISADDCEIEADKGLINHISNALDAPALRYYAKRKNA